MRNPMKLKATAIAAAVSACCAGPSLAAPVIWIDGSSFWDLAANWNPGVPAAADDATANLAAGQSITVRATGGPFVANSVTVSAGNGLSITNGSLTLDGLATADNATGLSSVSRLSHSGGTLGGAGNLTVTGAGSLGAGLQTGSGTTTLQGTSTLSGLALDAGRVLRNEGNATLSGGLNLNGSSAAGAGRIDNAAGALIEVRTFNLSIGVTSFGGDNGSDARIDNAGIFRKGTGGGYGVSVPFNNLAAGTIDVQAGSFNFTAGGSYAGAVTLAAGTALSLSGGTHSVHAGASFSGAGALTLSGSPTVLDLAAPVTVGSAFTMTGGTVKGADLTLTGATSLGISSSLGVMSGAATTTLQGTSSVGGGANNPFGLDAGRVLRNEGSMIVTGVIDLNRLNTAGAGRIENAAGALIDVQTFNQSIGASSFAGDAGTDARIDNAGIFRKSTKGNSYAINVPFNNLAGGSIDVQLGSFAFNAGSSHSGAVTLAANTVLGLGGGTHTVNAGATFTGPGTLALSGAQTVLTLLAPTTVDSAFSMSGGTISGADLILKGPAGLTISSSLGVMAGAASTTLRSSSNVGGGPNNPFGLDSGRVLRNQGTMVITGVIDLNRLSTTDSGRIENAAGALIDVVTSNQAIAATDWSKTNPLDSGADARVDNAGTFRKSTAGGYGVFVPFYNTGTVEVLAGSLNIPTFSNGGTLRVAALTSFTVSSAGLINEGIIQGNGSVIAPGAGIYNAGSISPGSSPGHLTLTGDLQMAANGIIVIEIADASNFDLLTVTGVARLGGELSITRLPSYVPAPGDTFTVMTFASRVGNFDRVSLHGFAVDPTVTIDGQNVVLGVTAVPEPATWIMLLAGLVAVGSAVRYRRQGSAFA